MGSTFGKGYTRAEFSTAVLFPISTFSAGFCTVAALGPVAIDILIPAARKLERLSA